MPAIHEDTHPVPLPSLWLTSIVDEHLDTFAANINFLVPGLISI